MVENGRPVENQVNQVITTQSQSFVRAQQSAAATFDSQNGSVLSREEKADIIQQIAASLQKPTKPTNKQNNINENSRMKTKPKKRGRPLLPRDENGKKIRTAKETA